MQAAIAIVLVLSVLIFFHELGHLVMAKRAGILCREFAIGFGPKLLAFQRGETRYTLRLFPIGGYVRMAGEDPELLDLKRGQRIAYTLDAEGRVDHLYTEPRWFPPQAMEAHLVAADLEEELYVEVEDEEGTVRLPVHPWAMLHQGNNPIQIAPRDRQFAGKSLWDRFLTIIAGPAMNFFLAVVVFIIAGLMMGVPVNKPIVGAVEPGTPAAGAGLQSGDRILTINSVPVKNWEELVNTVSASPGQQMVLEVERGGERLRVEVTPEEVSEGVGRLGIYQAKDRSLWQAIPFGFQQTWFFTMAILQGFGMLLTGHAGIEDLSGPVGIFQLTGDVAAQGIGSLLIWTAFLSINLGIFNILPIPALDGGRLMFLAFEAVRGKPVDPQKESMVHLVGFAFLMLLMIVVTYNDVLRLFG